MLNEEQLNELNESDEYSRRYCIQLLTYINMLESEEIINPKTSNSMKTIVELLFDNYQNLSKKLSNPT